ncbi:YgfZ/GcvT domain-containing protein [Oceanospirillum sp.]|uniref:CAF17-like 4Fe-4S cluster assembly/insertion protein YgfZ n=1 Tax=Oceanospirillum sp. TaxID=2021254 RepID=UPI003A958E0D
MESTPSINRYEQLPEIDTTLQEQAKQLGTTKTFSPLPSMGVLLIKGDMAAKLLHGQASQKIEDLPEGELRLSLLTSPKGRPYATFYVVRHPEGLLLLLPRSTLETTQTNLSKFAPLYRCTFEDKSDEIAVVGFNHADAKVESVDAFNLPGVTERSIGLCRFETLTALFNGSNNSELTPVSETTWNLTQIENVQILLEQSHTDQFIPQMLNYQATGAISFKKGCYTGQEIIARAQYRGGVKKRLQRLIGDGEAKAGDQVVCLMEGDKTEAGEVLLSAINAEGKTELLAVLKDNTLEEPLLTADDQPLTLIDLPYGLEKQEI